MNQPDDFSTAGRTLLDRRCFLSSTATGLSSIALASLLGGDGLLAAQRPQIDPARPYAPRAAHRPAKAKNVVVIFCAGAVSQLETWDYKPELIEWDGKPLPGGPAVTFQGPAGNLARPQYAFRQRGQTGKWVSDMIPHLAELTDDIAFVHSLTSKSNTHGPAENFLSTGFVLDGFPSLGSWVTYALGSENQDLPAYVAIPDPRGVPQNGSNNWGPGFLPAAFQGTTMSSKEPVRHLTAPGVSAEQDRAARSLLQRMNARDHNPDGFTCWLTGAGVKPGVSHGVTDDLGQKAVQDIHPLYDFNATILHLLGLDHEQLTFRHNGFERRLTNVEGHVIHELLA